jgi:hypothetical protein
MRNPALVAGALAVSLALSAAYAPAKPGQERRAVQRTLLWRMNSSADGTLTRRVVCARAHGAPHAYVCRLESVVSTSMRVDAVVAGDGLRETWYPLAG